MADGFMLIQVETEMPPSDLCLLGGVRGPGEEGGVHIAS